MSPQQRVVDESGLLTRVGSRSRSLMTLRAMPRRSFLDAPCDFATTDRSAARLRQADAPGKHGITQGHLGSAIPPGDQEMISAVLTAVELARGADGDTAGSPGGRPG